MTRPFPLTRASALTAWQDFQPRITRYAGARNAVTETHEAVSGLSPAIRLGLLRPEELVKDSLARYEFAPVEKWLQEVCWRTYWKGWLEMHPTLWRRWRQRVHELCASLPGPTLARCQAVIEGDSGVGVMDRFTRELLSTGYLHNHARMWWASFWIHVEKLPWELGADFFFQHLLDADPASNTLSWRWVAGLQTPGKTYLVRRSNLERWCAPALLQDQSGLECLADDRVSPFSPPVEPRPEKQELAALPSTLPQPEGTLGLWLHAEDTTLETSPLSSLRPAGIAAFTSTRCYRQMRLSPLRMQAITTALQDGLERAGLHFGCETTLADADCTATALAEWAAQNKVRHLAAMAPTTGPVADVLPRLRVLLDQAGIVLHLVRRPWDAALFPLAKAGFFPFWEKTRVQLMRGWIPGG